MIHQQESTGAYAFDASILSPFGAEVPADLMAQYAAIVLLEPEPETFRQWTAGLARSVAAARAPAVVKRAITLPPAERGRSEADIRRLDRLNARLAVKTLSRQQRLETIRERDALVALPALRAERDWQETAADETIDLARARGEEPQRLSTGAVRVNNRDALYSLVRKLSADQYDAGVAARACYEARTDDVGSQMGAQSFGGVHNNDAFVLARLQRAKKLQRIAVIERAIALECRAEPASLQMFRAVCGDNKPLSVWGEGRAFERNLRALGAALDVAHGVIRGK